MRHLYIFLGLHLFLSLSSEIGLRVTGYLKDGSYMTMFIIITIFSGIFSSLVHLVQKEEFKQKVIKDQFEREKWLDKFKNVPKSGIH